MGRKHWTLDDIPWDEFVPEKVDPDILLIAKAAAMVEYNGHDYATYLGHVFHDDPEFQQAARAWAVEEVQHGEVLSRWAMLADPDFDFESAFKRFTEGFQIPLEADESVRGSRSGELVARCIVEVGTSSYYSALGEATEEPVFKEICRQIAADELRHYKLFYTYLKRYLDHEGIGRFKRMAVAFGRMRESEDDELAYAYYAANGDGGNYDRARYSRAYLRRAMRYYKHKHIERAIAMTFKVGGMNPQSPLADWTSRAIYGVIRFKLARSSL